MTEPKAMRGFAVMTPETRSRIAAKGGASVPGDKRSFSRDRELAKTAGSKGGQASRGGGRPNKPPEAQPEPVETPHVPSDTDGAEVTP